MFERAVSITMKCLARATLWMHDDTGLTYT